MRKAIVIIGIILVALGAAAYFERAAIRDFLYEARQPELPAAVSFEEFVPPPYQGGDEGRSIEEAQGEIEELNGETGELEVEEEEEEDKEDEEDEEEEEEINENDDEANEATGLPAEINLAVPFTSQAPDANWDLPYQEACEEASVYMVHEFYEGTPAGKIDPAVADADILAIIEYENTLFGDYKDTTAEQTATLAMMMYGYSRVDVIEDPTVDEIKAHVAAGRPVVVPCAGRELGNPNFTAPGPLYHMLVIKGYTATQFITNDPGTRRGADYVYAFDTVMDAAHDWNGGDVANGAHVAIVIWPENE